MTTTEYRIGDLCSFAKGASVPRDRMKKQGLRYLHYGDLYAGHSLYIDVENPERPLPFIDPTEKLRADQFVNNGDIIYILTSETVEDLGKSLCLSNPKHRTVVAGTETTVMQVARQDIIEPRYLNYLLQTPFFQRRLRQYITGMKVFRVHPRNIARIAISVPSLTDQKKVIALLDSIHFKIRLNQQINDHLLEYAKTIFEKWLYGAQGDLVSVSEVADFNPDTYSPREQWPIVQYLDTGSITRGAIEGYQIIAPQSEKLPSRARRKISSGDIIYSSVRPIQEHYGLILNPDENVLVSTGFTVVRNTEQLVCPELLYLFLTQDSVTKKLQQIAEQSVSTYPSIKADDLAALELPLPSAIEAAWLQPFLENIFAIMDSNRQMCMQLAKLRDALLPKLISGEIDVSRIDLTQLNGHLSES